MNADVQLYIDAIADARRDILLRLQDTILRHFPEADIKISYQIPSYKVKTGWVFLGYWKQGVSIYVGYLPMLTEFKAKYPKIKTGKGSINLKLTDEIPWEYIEQLIKHALGDRYLQK
jgi:uncharacterized protein YdhG (YjbR/CyaY superfamily)